MGYNDPIELKTGVELTAETSYESRLYQWGLTILANWRRNVAYSRNVVSIKVDCANEI